MDEDGKRAISLLCTRGPLQGKAFELIGGPVFIFGRCSKSHFNLSEDSSISHLHFLIDISGDRVRIIDLGSTNGLKINLERLGGGTGGPNNFVDLRHGDVILAGSSLFRLSIGGKPLEDAWKAAAPQRQSARGGDPTIVMANAGLAAGRPDAAARNPPGELPNIDGYTLIARIGGGGNSVIYKAIKDDSGVFAAIKAPRQESGATKRKRLLDTFRREMEITRLLRHSNIIGYLGSGLTDDLPFLALEYIDGGNLAELIRREASDGMDLNRAAPLFIEILEAIIHMHEARITHRDIKPKNILLDVQRGGGLVTKLSDMGLACRFSNTAEEDFLPVMHDGGTPAFMPPEQLADLTRAIPQSDVFSAAATFYYMLTGAGPYNFTGKEQASVILEGDILPIRERLPGLQPEVAGVIDRALSPRPEDRHATARELLDSFRWTLS